MTLNDEEFFCVRYELNMMNVSQRRLFKEKKFYEIPNPIYRGWLGFKIAALGSALRKTGLTTSSRPRPSPRSQGQRREGLMVQLELPRNVTSTENLALLKNREEEKEVL